MERILLFVPMYNCERQIPRVLAQFDRELPAGVAEIILVDNGSKDGSVAAASAELRKRKHLPLRILQNDNNYGLGGSHKVAFNYALDNGFDYCIVLHGDDQGSLSDLGPLIAVGTHRDYDCLLGARFMPGSTLSGYSRIRTLGNHCFNLLFSLAARQRLYDLGSGLNMYATKALSDRFYLKLADDLTFNYTLILATAARGWHMRFFPLTWREDDQISNAKLVRQSAKTIGIVGRFALNKEAFLALDQSAGHGAYTWHVIEENSHAREATQQ